MTGVINLGNNYTVEEDSNGDLVITDGDGTAVMSHDDSGDQWTLEDPTAVNDLIDAVTSNTVYDASAEQVGDGNQTASLANVTLADIIDTSSSNTVYDSSAEQLGDGNQSVNVLNVTLQDIIDTSSSNTVYDSSAEQLGDGNQSVNVLNVTLQDIIDTASGNVVYDSSTETLGDGNQSASLQSATVTASPSASNDVAIKQYVDSVAQGLNWQEPVIDELNDPPGSPSTGDRYLIDDAPTGDWSGHPNEIAEWDGSAWEFFTPSEGWAVFIEDVDLLKVFQSGDWVAFGSAIDHGNLAGLGDDDHTQYLLVDGTRAMSGALDMGSNAIQNVTNADTDSLSNQDYNEAVGTQTGTSGTVTVDLSAANMHEIEADGDITIQFSNVTSSPPGNSILVRIYDADSTGSHAITWPASVEWRNGNVENTLPQDGELEIALRTYDGGTVWKASLAGEAFS
jgi:hypothetical protein